MGKVDDRRTFQPGRASIRSDLNGGFRVWRRHAGLVSLMAANNAMETNASGALWTYVELFHKSDVFKASCGWDAL